ncbi:uncharacterized protein LOC131327616 [Rhododendron vialii]|uniref:uncharacterized protein LOC131327616 n=1 Tax=Rhododendron vialii TaxID=182163 RepID=UPI00265D703C|nr:uncharacterized protein LOC131327616 [Rhododendron vialii]
MDTMEVEKQVTDVVVMEQKPQKEGDTSTLGSYVVSSTIPTSTRPPYDYTEYFTTETVFPSDETLNHTPWMRFSCERSGKYRPFVKKVDGKEVAVKKRVQSTGTKKCEYPFELKAVKGNDGWTIYIHNGTHNHPPVVYLEGHSYAGRLSAEQTSTVVDLSVALVKPREILSHLKVQDLENIKTIYNGRQKYRVIEKPGKLKSKYCDHFVTVHLRPNSPIPPIARNWYIHHYSFADGWDTQYCDKIKEFKNIGNDVATTDIIELD